MEIKPVYFFKKKSNQYGNPYLVVTNKPAIKKVIVNDTTIGVREQGLKFGNIFGSFPDSSFTIGDEIPNFSFTDQKVEGMDNLYKIEKVR